VSVEYARARNEAGERAFQATLDACRLRLRPIIMTSFAFIFGVVPLVLGRGAGAEMRRTPGTAVFAGMLGVTVFGILLTPVVFYVIQRLTNWRTARTDDFLSLDSTSFGGNPGFLQPEASARDCATRSVSEGLCLTHSLAYASGYCFGKSGAVQLSVICTVLDGALVIKVLSIFDHVRNGLRHHLLPLGITNADFPEDIS